MKKKLTASLLLAALALPVVAFATENRILEDGAEELTTTLSNHPGHVTAKLTGVVDAGYEFKGNLEDVAHGWSVYENDLPEASIEEVEAYAAQAAATKAAPAKSEAVKAAAKKAAEAAKSTAATQSAAKALPKTSAAK